MAHRSHSDKSLQIIILRTRKWWLSQLCDHSKDFRSALVRLVTWSAIIIFKFRCIHRIRLVWSIEKADSPSYPMLSSPCYPRIYCLIPPWNTRWRQSSDYFNAMKVLCFNRMIYACGYGENFKCYKATSTVPLPGMTYSKTVRCSTYYSK